MAVTFNISSSQDIECGKIYVNDKSEYISPDIRENYGIILFVGVDYGSGTYIIDPTMTDYSNSGTTDVPGEWIIDPPNQTASYEITGFLCPLWDENTEYNFDDVVYYPIDGRFSFWRSTKDHNTDPMDGTHDGWMELGITRYSFFLRSTNTLKSYAYETIEECPNYKIIKSSCTDYILYDNSENENAKQYSIETYNGEEIVSDVEMVIGGQTSFILLEDDVYIITIKEEIEGVYEETYSYPIYQYCDIKNCTVNLITDLLCNENDPCCTGCDSKEIELMKMKRYDLNLINAMVGSLLYYINIEKMEYLGVSTIDEDRLTYITMIGELISKLKDVMTRCGSCTGATSSTSSTSSNSVGGCNSCN